MHFLVVAAVIAANPSAMLEVQGHRGARALLPENTLPAFRHAIAVGADVLELDLQVTKDDVVVVAHDPRVPPQCDRLEGRAFRSLTWAEVQTLDCGAKPSPRFPKQRAVPGTGIPRLVDVFALGQGTPEAARVRFNIETKIVPAKPEESPAPDVFARLVLAVVDGAKMRARTSIQSFDHRVLHAVKAQAPDVVRVALVDESHPDLVAVARAAHADVVSPHHQWLTADDVRALHAARLRVIPWTVNEPADWQRLADMGVDGIITDDPAALVAWLRSSAPRRPIRTMR